MHAHAFPRHTPPHLFTCSYNRLPEAEVAKMTALGFTVYSMGFKLRLSRTFIVRATVFLRGTVTNVPLNDTTIGAEVRRAGTRLL